MPPVAAVWCFGVPLSSNLIACFNVFELESIAEEFGFDSVRTGIDYRWIFTIELNKMKFSYGKETNL